MAKLNYFELITNASAGCLSDEDFAMVCQAYSMEKNIYAAKVIQKKWYHSSGVQVADSLEKFGGEVFSSNLWTLYFEYKAKNAYHKEVEDLLLERAVEEQFVFAKLPHPLSEESEIKLISIRTGDIVPELDFQVAATSYAIFNDTPVLFFQTSNKYDKLFSIHRIRLDAVFGNLKTYLEKFAICKSALLKLMEIALNGQRKQVPYFSYDYLKLAVKTLAFYDAPDALDDEKIQLQLLRITIWNKLDRCVNYPLKRQVLCRYNMDNPASDAIVDELLKYQNIDFLRELLSHSWLKNGKQRVLQKYPELKAEILLADLAHEASISNPKERRYIVTPKYLNLLLENRESRCRELQPDVPINELSILNLCLRMYNTYENCHFTSGERSQILEETVHYCEVFGTKSLKEYIPQLKESVREEKHRIYCL